MNPTTHYQKLSTDQEVRQQLKIQLAQHLAQQPESTQAVHKVLTILETVGAGIFVAAFIFALYVSIAWKSFDPLLIPIAWFTFAASIAPLMICLGLDAITLRAFPPTIWPGKPPKFVTGAGAVWTGWAFIFSALAAAAFWGVIAYAVGTLNFALITPLVSILAVVMGVAMAVSMVYKLIHDISRSR